MDGDNGRFRPSDEAIAVLASMTTFSCDEISFAGAKTYYQSLENRIASDEKRALVDDILELERVTTQLKLFDVPAPRNPVIPPRPPFQWLHGRIFFQIVLRVGFGFILLMRDYTATRIALHIVFGLITYLLEIGALGYLIRLLEDALRDPTPRQEIPVNGELREADNQPNINANGDGAVDRDRPVANPIANGGVPPRQAPRAPRGWMVETLRVILGSLRSGIGLPNAAGRFMDIVCFVLAFVLSLIPEWNVYGAV